MEKVFREAASLPFVYSQVVGGEPLWRRVMLNKKNPGHSDFPKAVDLLRASLAIALLLMIAGVAKALDPIANWPDLKALLHSQADSKAVTLSPGASLVLDASNAVLAPDLSLVQVNSVKDPTVVIPANGVLAFAVDRDHGGATDRFTSVLLSQKVSLLGQQKTLRRPAIRN